jgi:hypothetical protein
VVAAGAVALRIGGQTTLISAIGLDFVLENPELKENLDYVLETAASLDPWAQGGLFLAAWTAIKMLCFDVRGVILALSSGILFEGGLQGAVIWAFCATVGSLIAFAMAKLDTPVCKRALDIVNVYPLLHGIEKLWQSHAQLCIWHYQCPIFEHFWWHLVGLLETILAVG